MGAIESRAAANRQLYRRIGDFLAAHALAPTPGNYALIYELVTETDSPLAAMVAALTGDGVRLSERDVEALRQASGHEADAEARSEEQAQIIAEARRSVESFASLVKTTQAETSDYGRDLDRSASQLGSGASDDISALMLITGRMLERTRTAETQLQNVTAEVSTLRERLQEAELAARSDPLTRLPNRRAFEDRLGQIVARGGTCSLAICDIDHFKTINDSHGHPVGDRVLRMVAEVLQEACKGQLVARLGGEEFVVLFDGIETADAGTILDRARDELGSRTFRVRGTDAPIGQITFSAGVARCVTTLGDEPPLKRADSLLYRAKDSGRNRVIVEA